MKKILYIGTAIIGAIAGVLFLKGYLKKNQPFRFIEEEEEDKNFRAFPPDIPAQQFENWLFI
jgi:hypothetical protein